jgi:hypothetical protein
MERSPPREPLARSPSAQHGCARSCGVPVVATDGGSADSAAGRPRRTSVVATALAALLVLSGCAVVPTESATLSATVGRDLLEIKKSHIFYVNSFYDRVEAQANRIVDQEFAPALIAKALNGASGKFLMKKLEDGRGGGQAAQDAVAFVHQFLVNVNGAVEAERTAIVGPIEQNHKTAVAQVEQGYAGVLQGNATITAYLTSLIKLHAAQNELFAAAGVPTFQDDVAVRLSKASDDVDSLLTKAKTGEVALDEAHLKIQQILKPSTIAK